MKKLIIFKNGLHLLEEITYEYENDPDWFATLDNIVEKKEYDELLEQAKKLADALAAVYDEKTLKDWHDYLKSKGLE